MKLTPEKPTARDLVDRSRVLVKTMTDRPDESGPNYVLLMILAEQLQMLRDAFEEAENRQLQAEILPE
ncbi:hypothetical protein [Kluyvera sichuanensis]|uniref:hypothetical protein n=1 Tax=Kluyvera sichuanensis TaxID=2725494 RepID=UPI0039F5109D